MKFKFLEHTADVKFQAFGKTLGGVFANAALAMFNVMYKDPIKKTKKFRIKVDGRDLESLLYNFLEEFLFLLDTKGFFLSKIKKIKIDPKKFVLEADVEGDDAENYEINLGVKAVTYNDMFIKKQKDRWIVQVVIDV